MWLKEITLLNFKNYQEESFSFIPGVNALVGDNGSGKTNLLDAIHYLCLCKSYFNPIDSQQIRKEQDWFMIHGNFLRNEVQEGIVCSVKRNQKKQFKRNKKEYTRLADHIGLFPLVLVSPNDTEIISEGSEVRRKFIDNVISQTDNLYLDELIRYNRHLQNRNSYLKQVGRYGAIDSSLLSVLDEQLWVSGTRIYEQRKKFIESFLPLFNQAYQRLTDSKEPVSLQYVSQLHEQGFEELLAESLPQDRHLERTTKGAHRDDLSFSVNDMQLKKFGSQGQQKSFIIALKLAQYQYLLQNKNLKPLLLLDDIFDKLDDKRTRSLLEMVSGDDFGQLFITHTSADKLIEIFDSINSPIRVFTVEKGQVTSTDNTYE